MRSTKHLKHKAQYPRPQTDSGAPTESAKEEAMTREQALAFYHPIRDSVRRNLGAAISACNHSDLMRAAKQLGLGAMGRYLGRRVNKPERCLAT
jgi:hypothetical protein